VVGSGKTMPLRRLHEELTCARRKLRCSSAKRTTLAGERNLETKR
jgi:hypothetical protein